MSNVNLYAQEENVGRTADGTYPGARSDRSGIQFVVDAGQAYALNGEVYVANGGSATDPITFAGAYDADGPDFVIEMLRNVISTPTSPSTACPCTWAIYTRFWCAITG